MSKKNFDPWGAWQPPRQETTGPIRVSTEFLNVCKACNISKSPLSHYFMPTKSVLQATL